MKGLYNQEGFPHKGWVLFDVEDVRLDGQISMAYAPYETCDACGREEIRYVHILEHRNYDRQIRVGCNCAEKLTDDYINPSARERELRNRASRYANWFNREWKSTLSGNIRLKTEGHELLIYRDKKTGKYRVKIDETFGKKHFDTKVDAKEAAFKGIERLRERGEW